MNAATLVNAVKEAGGVLTLDSDGIRFRLPQNAAHLIQALREQKAEVIAILQAHSGRVATFPHCPRCAGYAVYRSNNLGSYECQTCGL
jgi:hypothetical protein